MKHALLASIAIICGCAGRGERAGDFRLLEAQAKSVCEVMVDPDSYVGQRIMMKGVYFATPHGRVLVGGDCRDQSIRVSHSLHVDGDREAEAAVKRFRRKHATVRIPVVYSGIVTAHTWIQGCTKPSCRRYSLEESKLLAALPRTAFPVGG